jgi:transcriptional repressor OPI1
VVSSETRGQRAPSVMSLDDQETREAAETLSGLKNMDFHCSPSSRSSMTVQPSIWAEPGTHYSHGMREEDPEPLLSLLTSSHPWLGGTINGSLHAYNSTMHYSPAFIRSSASFLERNIGTPVATGLGSVSRRTGVENRVRRYLGDRRLSDSDREASRAKRRRVREPSPEQDVEKGFMTSPVTSSHRSRAGSQASFVESLPAYDDNRSPSYEENAPLAVQQRADHNWRTKFVITTSGLGVALSESSLQSLKYCLSLLRTATDGLASIMHALRSLIDDYEHTVGGSEQTSQTQQQNLSSSYKLTSEQEAASRAIADRIKSLGSDIMSILHSVTSSVSRYAGSALPENAGALVRRQLMSVPQRWRVAEETTANTGQAQGQRAGGEAVRAGERFLVFAGQGCDMITQINLVLSGTVESAEKWLESMGGRTEDGPVGQKGYVGADATLGASIPVPMSEKR